MQFNFTHQSRLPGKRQPFILVGKDERLIRFMAERCTPGVDTEAGGLLFTLP